MKRSLILAAAAGVLTLIGFGLFGHFTASHPQERAALFSLVILTWLSLLGVILIYGLLTPWYRSRTGIGFMSTKVSFFTIISLTIINALWVRIPTFVSILAWVFIIITINFGITWNILYKQFFEHRADEMQNKERTTVQNGVHDTAKEPSQ